MTDMNALDILTEARELLSDPDNWTRYTLARDSEGVEVNTNHPDAVCWCAVGALFHTGVGLNEYGEMSPLWGVVDEALVRLHAASLHGSAITDNDEYGHSEVMATYARAIMEYDQ